MFREFNNNPVARKVGDCAVRAVAKALDTDWESAYIMLVSNGFAMGDMMQEAPDEATKREIQRLADKMESM